MGLQPERVYVVTCRYAPDAAQRRAPVRETHLARIEELMRQGVVLEAGAFADLSASFLMVRAPDEAAVRALLAPDVYFSTGVWTGEVEIRALDRLVARS
jgi:uncharacterized protein YciI